MVKSKSEQAEYNRALVRESFYMLGLVIQSSAKAKDVYRARLAELGNDLYRATYAADHIETLKEQARKELASSKAALYTEFAARLEGLHTALEQAHSLFDLGDPALTNALQMIEMAGADLGAETIERINAQFAYNQPALRALQKIYKARGVAYDGGLDRQVYNLSDAIDNVAEHGKHALLGEGSLNALAGAVGKVAKIEGVEFDALPDPAAVGEAARAGAGLPNS